MAIVVLLIPILAWAVSMTVWVYTADQKWRRCYHYAVEQANSRDVTDPKGQAYSDMATVLVLGGKEEHTTSAHPETPVANTDQGQL